MAPKAKAHLRRPAARLRAALRRPGEVPERRPKSLLSDILIGELSRLKHLWVKKGLYYDREVDIVGRLEGVRVSDGNIFIDVEATGARDEGLLQALTHVRTLDCSRQVTDEFLVHAKEYEQVDPLKEPWFSNLVKVGGDGAGDADELASLRAEADKAKLRQEGRCEESFQGRQEGQEEKERQEG